MFRKKIKKNLVLKAFLFLSLFLGAGSGLFLSDFALAQTSCPANTTVTGTTVTFVGELTDMGGDTTTYVWFEYGQTTAYGQKTIEKALSQTGFYCITVSGLLPSTTYHYRAVARNSADTSYGENRTFTTTSGPNVDLKANGSNGPITIPYDATVSLTWVSSNVNSCYASGAWSGTKSTSGSQVTEKLTSSRTFSVTCTGLGGSVTDSVTVNVSAQPYSGFSINKTVRNLSRGTAYSKSVYAEPGEVLVFGIVVLTGNSPLSNVIVRETLPVNLVYQGDLRVDNTLASGDIFAGLSLGDFLAGQKKTVTFNVRVAGAENFAFGQTELTNRVLVSSSQDSLSDTAKALVTKGAVAGVATQVPTGLTNNIFFDSFFLPLTISLSALWLIKSRVIKLEEWLDKRKEGYRLYKSKKLLQLKVAKIKAKELLKKIG